MDKNYWVNVYKCRKEILKLARNPECFCWGYDVDFIIGWYCDEIVANGGIGIKLINGVPFELYTHLGKVGIFSEIKHLKPATCASANTIPKPSYFEGKIKTSI